MKFGGKIGKTWTEWGEDLAFGVSGRLSVAISVPQKVTYMYRLNLRRSSVFREVVLN